MIDIQGANPEEITAVTFTAKAAEEMRLRLAARLGKEIAGKITVGTFHAVCMGLLPKKTLATRDAVSGGGGSRPPRPGTAPFPPPRL